MNKLDNGKKLKEAIQVSAVVLTYNANWEELKATIRSIMMQEECKFEIIIADDGSKYNLEKEVSSFFADANFRDYKFISNKTNVGTIKNLLNALNECSSNIVKDLGQGDILYDKYTLRDMYRFLMESNSDLIFGDEVPFERNNHDFNIKSNAEGHSAIFKNNGVLGKEAFLYDDYPNGATFIFKKDIMMSYLNEIEKLIVYCEDLSIRLMVLDGKKLAHFNRNVVFYEDSSGISSTSNGLPKVVKETIKFNSYLLKSSRLSSEIGDTHLRHLIRLRTKKRSSKNRFKRMVLEAFISAIDIRIPINRFADKFAKRKLNNVDKSFLTKCLS